MSRRRTIASVVIAAVMAAGCNRYLQSAEVEPVDPVAAAKTVILHVNNDNSQTMELRTVISGQSRFVGSVSARDSTDILLDPGMFPTGFLYVTATPADGRGRAVAGPLSASKGDKIRFSVQPVLEMSRAIVVR